MKKINWRIVNLALWLEVILSYLLPFQVTDTFQYRAGFPMPFLSVHAGSPGISPFLSMHLDPVGLLLDVTILYLAISAGVKICKRSR
ncbi:MAG: hypothetical protein HFG22_08925 [Lachnospiraceae bacterium]|nr:hypothetical protein [Lachnospiraceae bacterium]